MADKQHKQPETISLRNTDVSVGNSDAAKANPEVDTGGIWADEKATARAKHDRASTLSQAAPLTDALAVGGGQQSTPYQLETQADAIAKQTRRGI